MDGRKEKLKKDPYNVIISGLAGQGNVLLSGFIGTALLNEGFIVSGDTFGVSQRGARYPATYEYRIKPCTVP